MTTSKDRCDREITADGWTQRALVRRAAESSPGRKPGGRRIVSDLSPARGDRYPETFTKLISFCRPLRGLNENYYSLNHGLTPGAKLCRHLRWLVEQRLYRRRKALAIFLFTFSFLLFPFSMLFAQGNDLDYSKFLHGSARHAAAACSSCHHRNDNSARPGFPGHKDCTTCHLSQFTNASVPMCSICHTNVSGNNPPLKAFPDKFKENFNIKFDHAQHMTGAFDSVKPRGARSVLHLSYTELAGQWARPGIVRGLSQSEAVQQNCNRRGRLPSRLQSRTTQWAAASRLRRLP